MSTDDVLWFAWLQEQVAEGARRLDVDPIGVTVRGLHGRTAGSVVNTRDGMRHLRIVTEQPAWAHGSAWTGNLDANEITKVAKPTVLQVAEWDEAQHGRRVRAELMTLAPDTAVGTEMVLRRDPQLSEDWWDSLRGSLANLAAHPTGRVCLEPEHLRLRILSAFGIDIDLATVEWSTAHGDLHWANLTAPACWLLDWESWGTAPAGYDAATLLCTSLLVPDVAAAVSGRFASLLRTPSGAVAQLAAAAKLLRMVEHGDHPDLAALLHQHARTVTGVPVARRRTKTSR